MRTSGKRRQFTLAMLLVYVTLACMFAAAIARPDGIIWLTILLLAIIALWPWLYGHGG
jgi:uncharacterized membrane protein YcaP (DUF421 family)